MARAAPARFRAFCSDPVGVDPEGAYEFACEYLGHGFAQMLVDAIEYDGQLVDIEDVALEEVEAAEDDDWCVLVGAEFPE